MSQDASTSRNHDTPPHRYTAALADQIERRWQQHGDETGAFRQPNPGEPGFDPARPKFYCLDMFPYPSGAGLHVGHPEGYTATDIVSRFKRLKGYAVLHPMGWDAFGLPAEQYAIQTGIHPAITTRNSIDTFRRQLKRFGFCYDWGREYGTIDETYYRWTQWIFLQLFGAWYDEKLCKARPVSELPAAAAAGEVSTPRPWAHMSEDERRAFVDAKRLAYQDEQVVNWCPKLGTVLANDEVIDGRSERGGYPVLRKPLRQWVFRITAYAERLVSQLDGLDWPESTKAMQREWIGRSEGAEVEFALQDPPETTLRVFTTRPDTIFGATYMVVAPEHPLCESVIRGRRRVDPAVAAALRAYCDAARRRSDVERQESKEKTGVFTGVYAVNPATDELIPVWTADYVLPGYGTGAIMAVPAHDERDFEFARAFNLPIRDVVYPRAVAAMAYFAKHAFPTGDAPAEWREHMADFLGLATSSMSEHEPFDVVLSVIEERRRRPAPAIDPAGSPAMLRGSVRAVWLEALDEQGFTSFAEVRRRFSQGQHWAARGEAYSGMGVAANSANRDVSLNGLTTGEAKEHTVRWLEKSGRGRRKINYRLRDWVFSRQRYWGEPFPIVYDQQGRAYPISESHLPVRLPELADYAPVESDDPQPLLAKATNWVHTTAGEAGVDAALLPPETPVRRETNTMPGSAGSSWYAVRYCDPRNAERFVGREAERYWMGGDRPGVDLYLGGSEHAVGHLLYSRFWQNVLFDLGHVSTPEPFRKLFHQGLITSYAYQTKEKHLVPVDEVEEKEPGVFVRTGTGEALTPIIAKMSKSLKNVVNPDDVIGEFGADTFRLYEMYMGPLEASKPWNPRDIAGLFRFLQRLWRVCVNEQTGELKVAAQADAALERQIHRTLAKVDADIEKLSFNTAIAALIELTNAAVSLDKGGGAFTREQLGVVCRMVSPFTPHVADELWSRASFEGLAGHQAWPTVDPTKLTDDTVEVPVSVMGKLRSRVAVATGADAAAHEAAALADPKIQELIAGKAIKKVIVVPGKMVNLVLG